MPVSAKKVGGKQVAIGGDLNQDQIRALDSISVSAEDVFENLDSLNEELVESGYDVNEPEMKLPATKAPKPAGKVKKKTRRKIRKSRKIKSFKSNGKRNFLLFLKILNLFQVVV